MNKRVFFLALVGMLLLGGAVLALSPPLIDWDVVAGGGGTHGNGLVEISDTVGQPVIGLAQAGDVAIGSGFWYGMEGAPTSTATPPPTSTPTTPPNPTDTPTPTFSPTPTTTPNPTDTVVPPKHGLYLPLVRR